MIPRLKSLNWTRRRWILTSLVGLIALCCLCSIPVALLPDTTPTPEAELVSVNRALATEVEPTETQAPTETSEPTDTPEPTVTSAPTSTDTPVPTATDTPAIPAIEPAACVPQDSERSLGTVVKVIDGDTIDVEIDGQVYRVRYIGMDTPESTTQREPFGPEAAAKNAELVDGKTVLLVRDVSETDRFDRLLRYVFVGDMFVNYELVVQGYANPATFPPDVACVDTFAAAEEQARSAQVGLWFVPAATDTPVVVAQPTQASVVQPTQAPAAKPTATPGKQAKPTKTPGVAANCDKSYPDVCIPPKSQAGDLNCGDIPYRRFKVLSPDPHNFDGDGDGIGCES